MVVAFIPARGGSKSIPLKNIKPLAHKPLICWAIEALENAKSVDQIIVATDSDEIKSVVDNFRGKKTTIFKRSPDNAQDTSSTESVMLEYIQSTNLEIDDVFMLVQATSPLTRSCDFDNALRQYQEGLYDSMLSCVRSYRFFWSENGSSVNYDYRNRPRRQDFGGNLMENGAFYINKVGNIIKYKNRLSGNIGIYELPAYMATEIDEPSDWIVMENIIRKHFDVTKKNSIKLVMSDVDGVLTDGGMYYSENGDELKKFNTRDGMAFRLLSDAGIKTGIVTTEKTDLVARRANKIRADFLCQGVESNGKLEAVLNIIKELGISLKEVAYIGDDINCYELLSSVGFAACPLDAMAAIKSIPGIVILNKKGGDGVFREFAEKILSL